MIRLDGVAGEQMNETDRERAVFRKGNIDNAVERHIEEWSAQLGLDPYAYYQKDTGGEKHDG